MLLLCRLGSGVFSTRGGREAGPTEDADLLMKVLDRLRLQENDRLSGSEAPLYKAHYLGKAKL